MKQRFKSKVYQTKKFVAKIKDGQGVIIANGQWDKGIKHCYENGDVVNIVKHLGEDEAYLCIRVSDGVPQYVQAQHVSIK